MKENKKFFLHLPAVALLAEIREGDWWQNPLGIYSAWNAFLDKQRKTCRWLHEYSPVHTEHKGHFLCQVQ